MGGTSISSTTKNPLAASATADVLDDVLFSLGSDRDAVLLNRSATLTANTALTDVLIGTPVTPALAANSLIIANATANGDILIVGNDGGHSRVAMFFDSSTPDTYLYNVGGTWTAGATTWTLPAFTLGGAVAGNAQTISNANITVGASRTLDVSAGTLTLANDQISGDKITGGTIGATTISTLTTTDVLFSGATGNIRQTTTDASDNAMIILSGGGSGSSSRGALIALYGNEHGTYPGQVRITDGDSVGSIQLLGDTTVTGTLDAGTSCEADAYTVGGTSGADFSGAVTNLTVVKGIVTAAS